LTRKIRQSKLVRFSASSATSAMAWSFRFTELILLSGNYSGTENPFRAGKNEFNPEILIK
jgi:hypothetical protein